MRVLGLDVGSVRVGVALSDELHLTASPLEVIEVSGDWDKVVGRVAKLVLNHVVSEIVLGLPMTLSGESGGLSARRARKLGDRLKNDLGIDVFYWDERFSTREAERVLLDAGLTRKKRKGVVDKVAASLILQGYLDAHKEE